ncbi:hypothetical protein AVEN_204512-1 [Araneus ventricosus]|uniref:Uncharacterized protein n=2 Tax=Araneus ventricosus TaxID=182803 RepID=A0A4Y2RPV8_ARAVE|nr:hypothetical protein AVEN_204512-1 [Araneus ventricosus]
MILMMASSGAVEGMVRMPIMLEGLGEREVRLKVSPNEIHVYEIETSELYNFKFANTGELKGAVEKTPKKIIGPPTSLINEAIFLQYHPSNEGKRLKPAVLGVKAKTVDRTDPPG